MNSIHNRGDFPEAWFLRSHKLTQLFIAFSNRQRGKGIHYMDGYIEICKIQDPSPGGFLVYTIPRRFPAMIITASPVFIGKMIWSFVYGTADVILPIE
jgi:hypothetical protein